VRRFIDPEVEFIFVPAGNVPSVQAEQGAIAFDAPDAKYPHKNAEGLCSFAALVQERFSDYPILMEKARIVQAADFKDHLDDHPAARGLQSGRSSRAFEIGYVSTTSLLPSSRKRPINKPQHSYG